MDAKKKLEKVIPTTMAALVGRWQADSTFNVDDTHATGLGNQSVILEIFADTSYSQLDSTHQAFQASTNGLYRLSGDTLIAFPAGTAPDTFLVKLRFLGNYLEVDHLAEQRFTFFHKLKPPDSTAQEEALRDSLWSLLGHRVQPGIFRAEPLVRDFAYLRFSGDSMWMDTRDDGIWRVDSGVLEKSGSTWSWKPGKGTVAFLADLVQDDSLRLWPLTEGRPDSGYYLYARSSRFNDFDIDMRPLLGHMRSDSMVFAGGSLEYHFGRYYDWTFTADHKLAVETNMKNAPLFQSWSLDSGFVYLDGPGIAPTRFRLDTLGASVRLALDSGQAFGKKAFLFQTKVDPETFRDKPLERFQQASYFQAVVSGDTSEYFFNANDNGDHYEIANMDDDSTRWTAFNLNRAQENFQSGQQGFFFAIQGRNAGLGRYTCVSSPSQDLVIRLTGAVDSLLIHGLVQGACKIRSADSAFTDSTLALEGSFRMRRKTAGLLASPLWSLQ